MILATDSPWPRFRQQPLFGGDRSYDQAMFRGGLWSGRLSALFSTGIGEIGKVLADQNGLRKKLKGSVILAVARMPPDTSKQSIAAGEPCSHFMDIAGAMPLQRPSADAAVAPMAVNATTTVRRSDKRDLRVRVIVPTITRRLPMARTKDVAGRPVTMNLSRKFTTTRGLLKRRATAAQFLSTDALDESEHGPVLSASAVAFCLIDGI